MMSNEPALVPQRASSRFLRAHPAHLLALGLGCGLSPKAPGTVGTLWAWVAFLALTPWMNDVRWAALLMLGALVGWWACTVTARHLGVADPSSIVWDEVLAFWLVLWLVTPCSLWEQLAAFALFRFFDAAKPGPVAWADQLFHAQARSGTPRGWQLAGLGILLDDLVAALCTLLVIALWRSI